jgi:hypothetical protein
VIVSGRICRKKRFATLPYRGEEYGLKQALPGVAELVAGKEVEVKEAGFTPISFT